ncbi:hypothetical protein BV22DRAFT_1130842 [Leucogyrophana mollusca]|uniref:Uncharacterized protein n=1 Tax=Leucogyrophana mollusca TaxID=85980 RepID=A0ACB8BCG8_9AGAM|nr:hypothetical protein BV22DRAFT_1130842 [Leucogyrophana mollusca]
MAQGAARQRGWMHELHLGPEPAVVDHYANAMDQLRSRRRGEPRSVNVEYTGTPIVGGGIGEMLPDGENAGGPPASPRPVDEPDTTLDVQQPMIMRRTSDYLLFALALITIMAVMMMFLSVLL